MIEREEFGRQEEVHSSFEVLAEQEGVTAEKFLGMFVAHANRGAEIKAEEVLPFLDRVNLSFGDLGMLVMACTQGLVRVAQQSTDVYLHKLPLMKEYRRVRRFSQDKFDKEINWVVVSRT